MFSLEYFDWKTKKYKANQMISKSFDWINFSGKNVLDIGCGVGYYAIPLSKRCARITGIDISAHAIDLARQYASALLVRNAKFEKSDLLEYSSSESFDIVYLITVFMHIQDVDQALCKISSFLKPGGLLLISDLNKWYLTRFFIKKNSLPYFYQTFTFSYFRRKLQENGFEVVQESGRLYSFLGKRKPDWMVADWMEGLAKFWPFKYFGEHISVLAKRL
jgi:2-polyprenyl-3-methyl-5-hydroxy-6-metoxy-1,4-benzoquinol methylase